MPGDGAGACGTAAVGAVGAAGAAAGGGAVEPAADWGTITPGCACAKGAMSAGEASALASKSGLSLFMFATSGHC